MKTNHIRVKLAWLTHAGRMARQGNIRGYTAAWRILNDLDGPLLLSQLSHTRKESTS